MLQTGRLPRTRSMYTSVCKRSSDRPPSAEGEHREDSFDLDVTKQMWQTRQLTVSMTSQTGNLYFCPCKKKVTLSSSPENWQNTEAALKSRPLHGGLWSATHSCRDHCFTSLTLPLLRSNNIPSVYFHGLHLSEEALSVLPWEQRLHRSGDQNKHLLQVSTRPACLVALEA